VCMEGGGWRAWRISAAAAPDAGAGSRTLSLFFLQAGDVMCPPLKIPFSQAGFIIRLPQGIFEGGHLDRLG
jgi:hypothetical protein